MTTKRITLHITKRDIEKGVPGEGHSCAVALAAGRRIKPGVHIVVGPVVTYWTVAYIPVTHSLPTIDFIDKFDKDKSQCRPCRLPMDVPEELLR